MLLLSYQVLWRFVVRLSPCLRMSQPEIRSAVVLVVDRLGANMLGAYGSTWFETQNFNRLAARSLVFDHAITTTPELAAAYRGLWDSGAETNMLKQIREAGFSPVLLTDEPEVANLTLAEDFDRIIPVDLPPTHRLASSLDQTELANFFAQATQAMTEMDSGTCLWLHSRGLSGAWDAPGPLRIQLADPEDPDPPQFHEPPVRTFDPEMDDPDELLGYQQVCAAQVTLLDDFLGVILDLLDTELGESTLFCLFSTRGYPLGEHGRVGEPRTGDLGSCYSELVHVPMMVCLPNQPEFESARSIRTGSLVQLNWISDLLIHWFVSRQAVERAVESMFYSLPDKQREVACTIHGEAAAIHTQAWKLIRDRTKVELFAKPDDRGEVNDVSRRCPHIVESLVRVLDQLVIGGELAIPVDFELPEALATRLD